MTFFRFFIVIPLFSICFLSGSVVEAGGVVQAWKKNVTGSAATVAVDKSFNVVVGGNQGNILYTYRYDKDGELLWENEWTHGLGGRL